MWQPGDLDRPRIRTVNLIELIIGKLVAFLDRGAVRDAWDIGRLPDIARDVLESPDFRKRFIAMSAILDQPLTSYPLPRIKNRLTETLIAQELTPLLTSYGADQAWTIVQHAWKVVDPLLTLSETEREFVAAIGEGVLDLNLLFPQDRQEATRLASHPALDWKIMNVREMLQERKGGK